MIVAIIDQTNPVGQVRVRQFREADTEQDAVDAFVNDYDPPLDPNDWLGFDTGWSEVQKAPKGFFWAYDFNAPGLVQVAQGERFAWRGIVQIVGDPKARSAAAPNTWEDLGAVRLALRMPFMDLTKAKLRVWGRYRASAGAGPGTALRLAIAGNDFGSTTVLTDSAPFTSFVLNTQGSLPGGPPDIVRVQGQLNDPAATLEVELVSIAFLEDRF